MAANDFIKCDGCGLSWGLDELQYDEKEHELYCPECSATLLIVTNATYYRDGK